MLRRIYGQSLSVWSRGFSSYLNCNTLSTRSPPYLPYRLKSISPNICASSKSLRRRRISVALSHLAVCLCCNNLSAGICIPYWLHLGSDVGTSCGIVILDFQFLYQSTDGIKLVIFWMPIRNQLGWVEVAQ